ncbi:MAG: DUF1638 domain-containing protein [Deltaproteobacteria bacterium]|jgi:hypothetical protein|nr:DUF1638 domain-containing protein [Deltaproteobacteria bacterium]
MKERRVIIGCGIFEDEARQALKDEKRFDLEIRWLQSGYHVRTDWLADQIKLSLGEDSHQRLEDFRILYGTSCLIDLGEDVKSGLKILPTDNCLTAMVGRKRLRELEEGRTMVITNSWLRKIYLAPPNDFPLWDPVELRMNLGRYDRVLVLDTGLDGFTDEEILTAYDLMGVVLEFEKCDLGYFNGLVAEFLT